MNETKKICSTGIMQNRIGFASINTFVIFLFIFICTLISATQIFGLSRDIDNYKDFFNDLNLGGISLLDLSRFEPGFVLFSYSIIKIIQNDVLAYSAIVGLSLFFKLKIIDLKKISVLYLIVILLLYFFRYFPLHELTQLRVACSISLLLLGLGYIERKNFLVGRFFLIASIFFHFSMIAVIPFLFFPQFTSRIKLIVFLGAAFALLKLFSVFILQYAAQYVYVLSLHADNGNFTDIIPNGLSPFVLLDLATTIYFFILWPKITYFTRQIIFLQAFGLIVFYSTIDLGLIAIRMKEVFGIFYFMGFYGMLRDKASNKSCIFLIFLNILIYGYTYFFYKDIPFFNVGQSSF